MERRQEQFPQGAPQPIPLVQILPDGRLAYVSLPMAPGQPSPMFSPSSTDVTTYRDRWARMVKVAGVLFLCMGVVGMAARLCFMLENDRAYQWTLWGIAIGLDFLAICTGLFGLRAGNSKTAANARSYLRFLVFFAVLYVLATIVGTVMVVKIETKWVDKHKEFQPTHYSFEGTMTGESPTVMLEGAVQGRPVEEEAGDWESTQRDREGRPWHRRDHEEGGHRREEGHRRHRDNEEEARPHDKDEGHRRRDRNEEDRSEHGPERRPPPPPDREGDERRPHDKDEGHRRRERDGEGSSEHGPERRPPPPPDREEDERRPHDKDEGHRRRDRDEKDPERGRHRRHDGEDDEKPGHRGRHHDEDRDERHRRDRDHHRHPRPWHRDEDDRRPDWDDWTPATVSEYSPDNFLSEESVISLRSKKEKKEKKEKYGDRDELQPLTRQEMEDALLVGAFLGVLCTISVCSCCVVCACKLVTHAERCEAIYPQSMQQFAYAQPQYAQPQYAQPVQAVPLASPGVYPNLAPVGSAVPYSR